MSIEIFLVAPHTDSPTALARELGALFESIPVAALFVPRRDLDPAAYKSLVRDLLPVTQAEDCALLVDNDPALAQELGADGVHAGARLEDIEAAVKALKPEMIVGGGPFRTRHEAMLAGEAGVDYVLFGALDSSSAESASSEAADEAAWWAETFEVPAVLYEPQSAQLPAISTEFVGFGPALWTAGTSPLQALASKRQLLAGAGA